ncbi:hypothetical protein Q7P36_008703 [Cladosporium allicinum]
MCLDLYLSLLEQPIHGNIFESPLALHLRSFGKRIRDCTTSLGYMRWSEDGQTIKYRDIELQIPVFKRFVLQQVQSAQQSLEALFILRTDESRAEIVPRITLHQIRDDPTNVTPGWSFLKDRHGARNIIWDLKEFQLYHAQVDQFLEALLLLVHLTAGQPARGTEITGIQHANTLFHRNVFVEDGLVSIVTSYHKGYTCTSTTKIIHRYLPHEISELVVYYLWLILPFVQKMTLLIAEQADPEIPTSNTRKIDSLIGATYRHVAIAISRRHLAQGGFKRDYDVEESATDRQTAHTSWTAGRLYTRGIEEAPGHVEARRAGFRMVSRSWHKFLGFSDPALTNKRTLQDMTNSAASKRARNEESGRGGVECDVNTDHLWEY